MCFSHHCQKSSRQQFASRRTGDKTYLHHLIIIDINAYRAKRVAKLVDLQGVACDGHVPLLDVVQLLAELKLPRGCVLLENLS